MTGDSVLELVCPAEAIPPCNPFALAIAGGVPAVVRLVLMFVLSV